MLKNSLLLLTSCVVIFIAAELTLRILGFRGEVFWNLEDVVSVDDGILNFLLRPNSVAFTGDVVYKLNSKGFRDRERDYRKNSDIFRVVVIGDSVAFGYKVRLEDSFSRQLEALLAQPGNPPVEIVTLAMPGLNTLQEAHLLVKEGSKYDPEMVIILYSVNDADAGVAYTVSEKTCRIELIKLPIPCSFKLALKKSAILYFIKDRIDNLLWKLNVGDQDDVFGSVQSDYFANLYRQASMWDNNVVVGLKTIADFSRDREIPVILVVFPIMYDFSNYKWGWIHDKLKKEGEVHGFYVVDLLDRFKQYSVNDLRIERGDFVHPGEFGHKLAALAVSELLKEDHTFLVLRQRKGVGSLLEPIELRNMENQAGTSGAND